MLTNKLTLAAPNVYAWHAGLQKNLNWERNMIVKRSAWFGSVLAVLTLGSAAIAAENVKVGVIGTFWARSRAHSEPHSGRASKPTLLSMGSHHPTSRWNGSPGSAQADPQKARAIAQELAVKDKVQYLAGFVFTPNAMAAAPVATQAKVPTVIFNASASAVVSKSDLLL